MSNQKTISGGRFLSFALKLSQFSTTQMLRMILALALLSGMMAVAMQSDKATPMPVQATGCSVTLNQQKVHIELGQGIESAGRWAQCELYDGHPVVVYSNLDQRLAKRGG
mgnify:CR=1 FL=1